MIPLGPGMRRGLGWLAAAGAGTETLYLIALAVNYTQDTAIDFEWVAFLFAAAVMFGGVTWLALLAAGGRMHWSTRVLFLALTPVTLFLFLASLGFWAEAEGWFDTMLAVAFTFSESAMMTTLPVLALSRRTPAPPQASVPEPETAQN